MPGIDMSELDFATLDPEALADLIKQIPDDQLDEFLSGRQRDRVLAEIFGRMGEQFRVDRAGSVDAVIHWKITGRPGGGSDDYETILRDGVCVVNEKLSETPKLTLTLSALTMLKLISGSVRGTRLVLTRKLRVDGDVRLAANLPTLFRGPR